jgi:hypothetical protein
MAISSQVESPPHVALYLLEGLDWVIQALDDKWPELDDLKSEFKLARTERHASSRPYRGLDGKASLEDVIRLTGEHARRVVTEFMEGYYKSANC